MSLRRLAPLLLLALSLGCGLDGTSRYLIMIAALFLLGALGEVIFARTQVPDVVWLILAGIVLNANGAVDPAILDPILLFSALTLIIVLFDGGRQIVINELIIWRGEPPRWRCWASWLRCSRCSPRRDERRAIGLALALEQTQPRRSSDLAAAFASLRVTNLHDITVVLLGLVTHAIADPRTRVDRVVAEIRIAGNLGVGVPERGQ